MTHVIFDECISDGACMEVCPVECIVPGNSEEWPWYYIDPDTCIDCGACVPECPVEAILPGSGFHCLNLATESNSLAHSPRGTPSPRLAA